MKPVKKILQVCGQEPQLHSNFVRPFVFLSSDGLRPHKPSRAPHVFGHSSGRMSTIWRPNVRIPIPVTPPDVPRAADAGDEGEDAAADDLVFLGSGM